MDLHVAEMLTVRLEPLFDARNSLLEASICISKLVESKARLIHVCSNSLVSHMCASPVLQRFLMSHQLSKRRHGTMAQAKFGLSR